MVLLKKNSIVVGLRDRKIKVFMQEHNYCDLCISSVHAKFSKIWFYVNKYKELQTGCLVADDNNGIDNTYNI